MKIVAKCLRCDRQFLLSQLLEGPVLSGACPWCGQILAPDYTEHLLETTRRLEVAGTQFEDALARLRGGWVLFRIDRGSLLGRLEALFEEHERPDRRTRLRSLRKAPRRGPRFHHLAPLEHERRVDGESRHGREGEQVSKRPLGLR
jgi:hypothetical protein